MERHIPVLKMTRETVFLPSGRLEKAHGVQGNNQPTMGGIEGPRPDKDRQAGGQTRGSGRAPAG